MAALILLVVLFGILEEPRPTQAQERMGCFAFNNLAPVLAVNTLTKGDSLTMTIDKCIERCQLRPNTYAGIRNGYSCRCGDSHHHTVNGPQLSDSSCTTTCSGDHKDLCGSYSSIVIFSVCSRGRYKNIIDDKPNCDGRCHCLANSICAYFNGSCVAGCDPGWSGAPCHVPACLYGNQPGCVLPCNCANNATCDETTGACPDGCRDGLPRPPGNETMFDWRGPGCRIGNVGLGKTATQSGTWTIWIAGNAIDGRLPPMSLTTTSDQAPYCAATSPNTPKAWWKVDLENIYHIINVTIFNRIISSGLRTSHFNITVSNTSDFTDVTQCAFYLGPLDVGANVTVPCSPRIVGRYVQIQRTGGYQPYFINVCEIVIMGYKVVETGCSGYKPPLCVDSCDEGRFGVGCESSCHNYYCNGGYRMCNHINGDCPSGCQDWYIGNKCTAYVGAPSLSSATTISVSVVSPTQVRLTWGRDDDITADKAVYYGYMTQYKISNESLYQSGVSIPHVHGEAEYSAIISGLLYNTWYTLRVRVYRQHNDLVEVSPLQTREVNVKTPCKAPDRVIIVNMTTSADTWPATMYLEWQTLHSGCDNITSVRVLFRRVGSDDWIAIDVLNPATSTGAQITNITEYGFLEVKVDVLNNEQLTTASLTHSVYLSEKQGIETISGEQNSDDRNAWMIVAITFAVLFGISLAVLLGVFVWVWRRHNNEPTNPAPAKSAESGKPDPNIATARSKYEGLVAPRSTVPESDYDEIRMEEREAM